MSHIEAIEAILAASGTPASLTTAQIEQIRTHIAELKKALGEPKK
jgi:hypothetical protein